jgi:hypothetical protein
MDSRNFNFNSISYAPSDLHSGSNNLNLRGGTSGVHMRNLSDIEPIKTKNKSFFNKYKESKKDISFNNN